MHAFCCGTTGVRLLTPLLTRRLIVSTTRFLITACSQVWPHEAGHRRAGDRDRQAVIPRADDSHPHCHRAAQVPRELRAACARSDVAGVVANIFGLSFGQSCFRGSTDVERVGAPTPTSGVDCQYEGERPAWALRLCCFLRALNFLLNVGDSTMGASIPRLRCTWRIS